MNKLFGQKQKKSNANLTKEEQSKKINHAIQELRQHIETLNKRKEHSDKQIAAYNKAAQQQLRAKNRKGALAKLKLRKQVEKRLESLENQMFNLEMQIMTLEESAMNQHMMDSMKVSAAAMQVNNPEQMIAEVEEVQETIEENMELQQEISDMLNAPLVQFDDDELEAELAELEASTGNLNYVNGNQKIDIVSADQRPDLLVLKADDGAVEEEDEAVKQMKQLEMELLGNFKKIDVQVVQTVAAF